MRYWLVLNPVMISFWEVIVTFLLANVALFFAVFVYMVHTEVPFSFELAWHIIRENVKSSEVLIYVMGVVAPTLWFMFAHWRARSHSNLFFVVLIFQGIVICTSAYIYGAGKTGGKMNADFVDFWAIFCLVCALLIWFATLMYKRLVIDKLDPSEIITEKQGQAVDLTAALRRDLHG